jgi:hypothetical protein
MHLLHRLHRVLVPLDPRSEHDEHPLRLLQSTIQALSGPTFLTRLANMLPA